jgi:hypothetical protein
MLSQPPNDRESRAGSSRAGSLYDDRRYFLSNGNRPQVVGRSDNRLCNENDRIIGRQYDYYQGSLDAFYRTRLSTDDHNQKIPLGCDVYTNIREFRDNE